jgi:acetyl esterase
MQGVHHGLDGERCVLWGESAGATLILMATVRLRDEKAPLPKAMLLFYGNFDGPKPTLRAQSKWFWQQYLGGDMDHPDPAAIPARQVLRGLPSAWLGVGNLDPLLVDTLGMHERLAAAGVPCTLRRYPGLPHAFMNLTRLFPGAVDALDEAVSFALDALATPPASLEGKKPS